MGCWGGGAIGSAGLFEDDGCFASSNLFSASGLPGSISSTFCRQYIFCSGFSTSGANKYQAEADSGFSFMKLAIKVRAASL